LINKRLNHEKSDYDGLDAGSWYGPERKRANDELYNGFGFDWYNDGLRLGRIDDNGHNQLGLDWYHE
jgi:hypothetical protein